MFAPQGQPYPIMSPQDMIDYAGQAGVLPPPIIQQNNGIAEAPPVITGSAEKNPNAWKGKLSTFGSFLNAIGSGINPNASTFATGLSGAGDTLTKHQQNIKNFESMQPYYQNMGYNVGGFDPRRGGGGLNSTPESLINLQSQVDQRAMNNLYRQQLIQAQQAKQQAQPTVRDLMMFNPQFRQQMQQQYDFSGGKNADILDRPAPTSLLENMLPKNVNMNYSGGLNSTKHSTATITHGGGSGGGKSGGSKPKTLY